MAPRGPAGHSEVQFAERVTSIEDDQQVVRVQDGVRLRTGVGRRALGLHGEHRQAVPLA